MPPQPNEITASEFDGVVLLTDAELAVFKKFGEGMTVAEIANTKGQVRSKSTIEAQALAIRNKLGLPNSAKLRVFAARFLAFQSTFEVTIVKEKVHQKLVLNHD